MAAWKRVRFVVRPLITPLSTGLRRREGDVLGGEEGLSAGIGGRENCTEAVSIQPRLNFPLTYLSGVREVVEVRVVIGYNGVAVCLVAVEIRRARSRHLRH